MVKILSVHKLQKGSDQLNWMIFVIVQIRSYFNDVFIAF